MRVPCVVPGMWAVMRIKRDSVVENTKKRAARQRPCFSLQNVQEASGRLRSCLAYCVCLIDFLLPSIT